MAQTFFNTPSLAENATANHGGASTASGDALARASTIRSAPDNKDPFVADKVMDTTPNFPNRNPNASGVRARCPVELVPPAHPLHEHFVVSTGASIGIFDRE